MRSSVPVLVELLKPEGVASQWNSFFPSAMSRAALLSQSQPNGDVISAQVAASNGQSEVLKVAGESNPFLSRQAPVLQQLIVTKKLEPL